MTPSFNYQGRKVDLSIFPDLTVPNVAVDARLGNDPKAIAGAFSLVQNYLRILLTPKGHYPSDPDMGSNFLAQLRSTRIQYPTDLIHLFLIESAGVVRWMKNNSAGLPDDEVIQDATLSSTVLTPSTTSLTIEIETRAGTAVSFLLPVNWSL